MNNEMGLDFFKRYFYLQVWCYRYYPHRCENDPGKKEDGCLVHLKEVRKPELKTVDFEAQLVIIFSCIVTGRICILRVIYPN